MKDSLENRVAALLDAKAAVSLNAIKRGLEKESLRITADGWISQKPHPAALGSALTHPWITTDYSEALLEFITPPDTTLEGPLAFLRDIHAYVYQHLDDEMLWTSSMPCRLGDDDNIPVARYGTSNIGQMKHIYRLGLGVRYGRHMQAIAGIHYNVSYPQSFWQIWQTLEADNRSLQQFISEKYFALLRNFQRYSWLLLYLFGASPAICACFVRGQPQHMERRPGDTLLAPFGTSLRMSDLGYQNKAQANLAISYNSLEDYVASLTRAIRTEDPVYKAAGIMHDGVYQQLNANLLQIENEYYSSIRPKQTTQSGERPTLALARRGVEYIEIRAVDLNPYLPLGIDQEQIRFLDLLATACLLDEAPLLSQDDLLASKQNIKAVACDGRRHDLHLLYRGEKRRMRTWGSEHLQRLAPVAELLDQCHGGTTYARTLQDQMDKLRHPETTPSGIIADKLTIGGQTYLDLVMEQSAKHRAYFCSLALGEDRTEAFCNMATKSIALQQELEAQPEKPLEDFIADYFLGDA